MSGDGINVPEAHQHNEVGGATSSGGLRTCGVCNSHAGAVCHASNSLHHEIPTWQGALSHCLVPANIPRKLSK